MGELVRLGETEEYGGLLVQLLELAGWKVEGPLRAFGGGKLWIATREFRGDTFEVRRVGDRLGEVIVGLLEDALAVLPPAQRITDVQLAIPTA